MNTRDAINAGVMLAVAGAMLGAVVASMRHSAESTVERERCYGIARTGQNDCANAVHSCAKQAKADSPVAPAKNKDHRRDNTEQACSRDTSENDRPNGPVARNNPIRRGRQSRESYGNRSDSRADQIVGN